MFKKLPGFRDFYPESCSVRNHIFQVWRRMARQCLFSEYDTPTLESLDLYVEKSGAEIVDQLYHFEDKGGRMVAMRPEMTPSVARLIGAKASSLKRPTKWFSIGEFYRYERQQKGRLRSFYQYNADIFGEEGSGADAELLYLLVRTFTTFGLTDADVQVRLSDRHLWTVLLDSQGFDESTAQNILGLIDKKERMQPEVWQEKTDALLAEQAESFRVLVEDFLALRSLAGVRSFFEALPLHEESKALLAERLALWDHLLTSLEAMGIAGWVCIDFNIVRGLAYYTGFVFEAFDVDKTSRALAGGGRYDHLVKKLGGPEMPAVGFAMGDVTLQDLLEEKGLLPSYYESPQVYCVIDGASAAPVALADVTLLREAGWVVDYALKAMGMGKQFKVANQSGAPFVIVYGEQEVGQGKVTIKDMKLGQEVRVARAQLVAVLQDLFAGESIESFKEVSA